MKHVLGATQARGQRGKHQFLDLSAGWRQSDPIAAGLPRRTARYLSEQSEQETAMFSHVMIGADDVGKAKAFYDKVLGTLGIPPGLLETHRDGRLRARWVTPSGVFAVTEPLNRKPTTNANGSTLGFAASSPEQVKAWHAAGVAAGGAPIEDPPGVREAAVGKLYIAYLRDLDGNKICALHRMG
jgi:catechol 2,3-dioxygenase-like lactoylglutathione lyase family enzyme